jgi:hypothetical protein
LAGTAAQDTDNLNRYNEVGLTMPLLWPPFQDVPVAKTFDDLKRLREEIMPQVDATQLGSAVEGRFRSATLVGEQEDHTDPRDGAGARPAAS